MPGQMEEMVRRMEAGEDAEKLEREYGDVFDEMESGEGALPADKEKIASRRSLKDRLQALRKRPIRDETPL